MEQPNLHQPVQSQNKSQVKADNQATKSDYKEWKDSLSYNDLVKFLETCYNEYTTCGEDLSLPKDVRVAYIDQAVGFKKVQNYIQRQAK